MDTTGLRSTQVCRRAGITYRQLDYWGRLGLITPPATGCGPGCPRRWSLDQVDRVCAIAAWVRLGVLASRAAGLVDGGHTAPALAEAV